MYLFQLLLQLNHMMQTGHPCYWPSLFVLLPLLVLFQSVSCSARVRCYNMRLVLAIGQVNSLCQLVYSYIILMYYTFSGMVWFSLIILTGSITVVVWQFQEDIVGKLIIVEFMPMCSGIYILLNISVAHFTDLHICWCCFNLSPIGS